MMSPLPMRFRSIRQDEAIPGFLIETANKYAAHPSALLEIAECPTSLARGSFLAPPEIARLAALTGQDADHFSAISCPEPGSLTWQPLINFNQTLLRRALIVAKKRRLAPSAMRESNFIRQLSLVAPIIFCPESWAMLTDHCLNEDCGMPLSWQKLEHVSECKACGSDQRDYDTVAVPHELQSDLSDWCGLIHPLEKKRLKARSNMPGQLSSLSAGAIFDFILGLSHVIEPTAHQHPDRALSALSEATKLIKKWPQSMVTSIDPDSATSNSSRQSLSTRLRSYAQSESTLPEIRRLLMCDLAVARGCALGAKAEIASAQRKTRAMGVRKASSLIGIAPSYVSKLRRAKVLETHNIARGQVRLELVSERSCYKALADLEDKISYFEFSKVSGFSVHAIQQLVAARHLEQRVSPAIDALYTQPMLRKSTVDNFLQRLSGYVRPMGSDDEDWIPLGKAMTAVGGRPKPYGTFFNWIFEEKGSIRAPITESGSLDLRQLYVSPMIIYRLNTYTSAFKGIGQKQVACLHEAAEILNTGATEIRALLRSGILTLDPKGKGETVLMSSIIKLAKSSISHTEIDARLGYNVRGAKRWLRRHRISDVVPGFASRLDVSRKLNSGLAYPKHRRLLLNLSVNDVERGGADVSDREWELARCWIPRQRQSRRDLCDRSVLNGAIWVCVTGRTWRELPSRYGNADTCYARFHHWERRGDLDCIYGALVREHTRSNRLPAI